VPYRDSKLTRILEPALVLSLLTSAKVQILTYRDSKLTRIVEPALALSLLALLVQKYKY
jgi:hypothetical protein